MKLIRLTPSALVAITAAAAIFPAAAYVLPFGALLDQLREQREQASVSPRVVEGTVALYAADGQRRVYPAARSLRPDGRCRMELLDGSADGERPHVIWDGARVKDSGGAHMRPLAILESIACSLSATGSHARKGIEEQVALLGVERRYTGYSRLDGRVAYVIGGRAWETERAQLWLDKDTLLPVRARARIDGVAIDIRMLGHAELVGGDGHPKVIQVYLDDRLAATFTAERVDGDVELSAALFR